MFASYFLLKTENKEVKNRKMEHGMYTFGNFMKMLDNPNLKCEEIADHYPGGVDQCDCKELIKSFKKSNEDFKKAYASGTKFKVTNKKQQGVDSYRCRHIKFRTLSSEYIEVNVAANSADFAWHFNVMGINMVSLKFRFTVPE